MVINFLTNGVQKLPLAENFQKICKTQPNAMEYVIGLTKKHGLDLMWVSSFTLVWILWEDLYFTLVKLQSFDQMK